MYTIGQFSKVCQLTTKALRYYEKIGLLIPANVDAENQYRYYTREQIETAEKIKMMKELGIPLAKIKQILEEGHEVEQVNVLLEEHRQMLLDELDRCNGRLIRLGWWRNALEARNMTEKKQYDIRIRDVQEITVRSKRAKLSNLPEQLPTMIRELLKDIENLNGVCAGPPIMLYYDADFNPEEVDVEVAWPVMDPGLATDTLPAIRAASYTHIGPYDGLEKSYEAVFAWINENGYQAVFPTREVSINDPQTTPPEQLATEILVPVIKK